MCFSLRDTDSVTKLDLSPDGRLILAGFADGCVRLFDLEGTYHSDRAGTLLGQFPATGNHRRLIIHIAISADGRFGFAGPRIGCTELRCWDLHEYRRLQERRGFCGSLPPRVAKSTKLRGFGAVAVVPESSGDAAATSDGTRTSTGDTTVISSSSQHKGTNSYRLLCGMGYGVLHVWAFRPHDEDAKANPAMDAEVSGSVGNEWEWQCVLSNSVPCTSITMLAFVAPNTGASTGENAGRNLVLADRAVVRGQDYRTREFDLSKLGESRSNRDIKDTEKLGSVIGGCGYSTGGDSMLMVDLNTGEKQTVEVPVSGSSATASSSSSSSLSRGTGRSGGRGRKMQSVDQVVGCEGSAQVLLSCADGGVFVLDRAKCDSEKEPAQVTSSTIRELFCARDGFTTQLAIRSVVDTRDQADAAQATSPVTSSSSSAVEAATGTETSTAASTDTAAPTAAAPTATTAMADNDEDAGHNAGKAAGDDAASTAPSTGAPSPAGDDAASTAPSTGAPSPVSVAKGPAMVAVVVSAMQVQSKEENHGRGGVLMVQPLSILQKNGLWYGCNRSADGCATGGAGCWVCDDPHEQHWEHDSDEEKEAMEVEQQQEKQKQKQKQQAGRYKAIFDSLGDDDDSEEDLEEEVMAEVVGDEVEDEVVEEVAEEDDRDSEEDESFMKEMRLLAKTGSAKKDKSKQKLVKLKAKPQKQKAKKNNKGKKKRSAAAVAKAAEMQEELHREIESLQREAKQHRRTMEKVITSVDTIR
jgi:hypothetical protein